MTDKPVELCDGFKEDCLELIGAVVAHKSYDFRYFCDEWKRMGFHYVFIGHTFHYELVQYIENCFLTLKKLFTALHTFAERVACLYLMYAMYFKQPTKDFGKFRFTMGDWTTMKMFYDEMSDGGEELLQAQKIFWHLWLSNAFRFVECDLDLESIQNKMQFTTKMFNFRKINPIIETEVAALRDDSKGLMSAIDILQAGYNEMKEHLSATIADCSGLAATKIATNIAEHVREIQANFEDDFTRSKRRRELQTRKRMARRSRRTETITADNDPSDECSMTSESDTADSNCDADNMVETGASSDSDVECLNIGSKRFYLKRKAMTKSVKDLKHMESISIEATASTSGLGKYSPAKTTQAKRKKPQTITSKKSFVSSSSLSSVLQPLDGKERLKVSKQKVKICEKDGKIIVSHPHSKRLQSFKTSAVAKQLHNCPPEVSAEVDGLAKRATRSSTSQITQKIS